MNFDDEIGLQEAVIPADTRRLLALWRSVFAQGLIDFALERAKITPGVEATTWFWNDSNTGPGSFAWLCELLGLDKEKARQGVLANWRLLVRKDYKIGEPT